MNFHLSVLLVATTMMAAPSHKPGHQGKAVSATHAAAGATLVQAGFSKLAWAKEFQAWQKEFATDLKGFLDLRKVDGQADSLLKPEAAARLRELFERSVDPGAKGDSFLRLLANGFADNPRHILGPGVVFSQLALGANFEPASRVFETVACGYGGKFQDEGREVHLLYVIPRASLEGDGKNVLTDPLMTRSFAHPHLPALSVQERDVFPAMVFVRDAKGHLKLYSMSKEFHALIQGIMTLQST